MNQFNDTWVYDYHTFHSSGIFTSLTQNTGGTAYFGTISWNADTSPNTSLRVQFRSADTLDNLSKKNFLGPDGTINSFYNISGQHINPINNGTRWFQYRAYFITNDITVSPVLHNVTINYNLLHSVKMLSPIGGEIWNGIRTIAWNASDPDNDKLLFDIHLLNSTDEIITLATNLTNQSWQWNTSNIIAGSYKIQIIARDDNPSIPLTVTAISAVLMIDRPPHMDLESPLNNSLVNSTSIRLLWHGFDPDGDELTYMVRHSDRPLSQGTILTDITADNYLDLTNLVDNATYFWTVDATDGKMNGTGIPTEVWSFTVKLQSPTNHLPHVMLISPADNSYLTTSSVRLQWKGTDPDNDSLNYTARYSDLPLSEGNILTNKTMVEYLDLSNLSDNKIYYWTVDVFDGKAIGMDVPTEIWCFTVRLPPANIPVRFTSTPPLLAWVAQEYAYNLSSIDEDGDIPSFSIVSGPTTMILNSSTGKLIWTLTTSDIGNHTVTIQVSDGRGSTDRQTFNITVMEIPVPPVLAPKCTITYPAYGSTLKGTIQVRGTALNGSFPLKLIQVRIDAGAWTTAVGLDSWTFAIDTTKLTAGKHRIDARAFDGNLSSDPVSVEFVVRNPEPGVTTGGNPWCLTAVVVAFVAGLGGLLVLKKKKR